MTSTVEPLPGLRLAYRPDLFDQLVIKEVVVGNVYRLPAHLDGLRVLDLGAHIGAFSVLCAWAGAANVRAFEPQPENLALLHRNVEAWPTVEVYDCAVGQSTGSTRIEGESWGAHVGGSRGRFVPQVSMTSALSLGCPDILKVDIEGAESALIGCDLSGIEYVVVETHGPAEKPWVAAPVVGALVEQLLYSHDVEVSGRPDRLGMLYAKRRQA